MDDHDALQRLAGADGTLAHDDPGVPDARARFQAVFDHFTSNQLPAVVRDACAEGLFFNDSLKAVREREALVEYLAESARAVQHCSVHVDEWTPRTPAGTRAGE